MYPASSCANYFIYIIPFIPHINLVRYNHLTFTDEETGLGRFCSLSRIVWLVRVHIWALVFLKSDELWSNRHLWKLILHSAFKERPFRQCLKNIDFGVKTALDLPVMSWVLSFFIYKMENNDIAYLMGLLWRLNYACLVVNVYFQWMVAVKILVLKIEV